MTLHLHVDNALVARVTLAMIFPQIQAQEPRIHETSRLLVLSMVTIAFSLARSESFGVALRFGVRHVTCGRLGLHRSARFSATGPFSIPQRSV